MSTPTPRVTLSLLHHLGINVADYGHYVSPLTLAVVHVPLLRLLGMLLLHHDVVVLWSLTHVHHFILLEMKVVRTSFEMLGGLRMIVLMNSAV